MAVQLKFMDILTGVILEAEELDLTEQEQRWCTEYQEWDEVRRHCQQNYLPLGVKEAYRKMDFIARDFLWSQVTRKKNVTIFTDAFKPKPFSKS